MNFFLKILNETRHRNVLKVDGASGKLYQFQWDGKCRAYVFAPKKQDEVDDLYRTMGRTTSYIFAPVSSQKTADIRDHQAVMEARAANAGKGDLTIDQARGDLVKKPLTPAATEQCLARGVIVTEDDSEDIASRLISAYDKGAADTLQRIGSKDKKMRRNKQPIPV